MILIRVFISLRGEGGCINEYSQDGEPIRGQHLNTETLVGSGYMFRSPERALDSHGAAEELV